MNEVEFADACGAITFSDPRIKLNAHIRHRNGREPMVEVILAVDVFNCTETGRPINVCQVTGVEAPFSEGQALVIVENLWSRLMYHEFKEMLKVDDVWVYDPHNTGRETA